MEILHVPTGVDLGPLLPKIAGYLGNISDRGSRPLDTILDELRLGEAQLHLAMENGIVCAVALTSLPIRHEGGLNCRLTACAGDGAAGWSHLVERIEQWASERGCVTMEAFARRGWKKILAPHGYVETHVILEKEL